MPTLFDRTLLPEALGEFVVISDTHYALAGASAWTNSPPAPNRANGRARRCD